MYEYKANGRIEPFNKQGYPPVAVAIEITELYSEKVIPNKNKLEDEVEPAMRHWTLACEAIGLSNEADKVDRALDKGATELLQGYRGPALTADSSYGYPRFAISV